MITSSNVARELLLRVPELSDLINYHTEDYQVMNYMLFGDVARYVVASYNRFAMRDFIEDLAHVQVILRFVEEAVTSGDNSVLDIVQSSFLESIYKHGDVYDRIQSMLGPKSYILMRDLDNRGRLITDEGHQLDQ